MKRGPARITLLIALIACGLAVFTLNALCGGAVVNAANCAKLGALGRDVLCMLDAAGAI